MDNYEYHDVLAELGVGSAHPGGFQSTIGWCNVLRPFRWRVLEVGCGTGRTSCFLAKQFGCIVTGVDVRPKMIEKARHRAAAEQVAPRFEVRDVMNDTLWLNSFDLVVVESVTIFLPIEKAFAAYKRQLRQGGMLIDVEMARRKFFPLGARKKIRRLYGATSIPTASEWLACCENAGFRTSQVLFEQKVSAINLSSIESQYPDLNQEVSPDALKKRSTQRVLKENAKVMFDTGKYLNYVTMLARH